MEMKRVYVIYDVNKFSKADIVEEIKQEGWKHEFCFFDSVEFDMKRAFIMACEEVWTFGDCTAHFDFQLAWGLGCDIWKMQ